MSNVDQAELEKFSQVAHKWWDTSSEFKPLHDINPLRLDYISQQAGGLGRRMGGIDKGLQELRGHTDSDLVLIDRRSGVAFIGGLAFADRIPTTPHARIPDWLASLDTLAATLKAADARVIVPSHGPVRTDPSALFQTRDYLRWLDQRLSSAARGGLEMAEILKLPIPAPYKTWAAVDTEYLRNVVHLFPGHEQAVLRGGSR